MQTATVDNSKDWTVEDYLQLEEGLQAQLIDGRLIISPVPDIIHQETLGELYSLLKAQLDGEVFFSPVDLYLDQRNVLQPDLVYVSKERSGIISERGIEGVPDLVVEIISVSNGIYDRNTKRQKYLDFGVTEYWIVDPLYQTLEIYTPTDRDEPRLHLIEKGMVHSLVSSTIQFDIESLFPVTE